MYCGTSIDYFMEDKNMSRLRLISIFSIFIFFGSIHANPGEKIQVALLLDTSNSMDGLIDQAKSQLWKVVNEFALAKRNGKTSELEIALLEYGNDRLSREDGYVRLIVPLTADLDLISEKLFNLTTNGGSEYCGWVIQTAAQKLNWDENTNTLKVIFVAGNEPFSQGTVDYRKACRETIARGIIVNTIFCGDFEEGVRTHWKEGAELADGKYMNIDQDKTVVHINAPQDEELLRLNETLNATYIPYGERGGEFKKRQLEQDANAEGYGAAILSQRAVSKASAYYKNTSWDLVDAMEEGEVDLEKIDTDQLPTEMQEMTMEERIDFINQQKKKREEIQSNIQQLNEERRNYVAAKQRELYAAGTLDDAIIKAVREQAVQKNFQFE
jgi:hypothetical protein